MESISAAGFEILPCGLGLRADDLHRAPGFFAVEHRPGKYAGRRRPSGMETYSSASTLICILAGDVERLVAFEHVDALYVAPKRRIGQRSGGGLREFLVRIGAVPKLDVAIVRHEHVIGFLDAILRT